MNASFSSRWLVAARLSAIALGFTLSSFVACSPDEDTEDPAGDPADCKLIANRCHFYDDGSNLAHECHDVGHDGESPKQCSEMKAQCLAFCPPRDPDAGMGGSAGSSGGSAGSGSGATTSGGMSTGGTSGGETSAGGQGGAAGEASGGAPGSGGSAGQGATSTGGANAAGSGGLATGGSGGGTAGSGGTGETACETLGRVCHGVGSGFTEECHELGHDGNEPACQAELAACLAACTDGGV